MPKRKSEGIAIELRKLTIYERMSEETTAFVAEIYINGINAGHAKNDGHGGSTFYHAYPEHRKLIEEAERQCLALPSKVYPASHGMNEFSVKMDLETLIDGIVEDKLREKDVKKFQNKIEKKMANCIMWGVPNSSSYVESKFKMPFITAHATQLQKYIDEKVKPNLKEGEVILNTNLQALGITI